MSSGINGECLILLRESIEAIQQGKQGNVQ